jgi:hypothetical protein
MFENFPTIDAFFEEVNRMKLGLEILNDVWNDIGPYNMGEVSKETLTKLHRFFKFDDSE